LSGNSGNAGALWPRVALTVAQPEIRWQAEVIRTHNDRMNRDDLNRFH
jgi:hypothetical protein